MQADREKDKTESLLDEKDALLMQLQSQLESQKAEFFKLQISAGEEKQKAERSRKQGEKDAEAIQAELKRLTSEVAVGRATHSQNESLQRQLLRQQTERQQETERLRAQLREHEATTSSLRASLATTQKQLDDSVGLARRYELAASGSALGVGADGRPTGHRGARASKGARGKGATDARGGDAEGGEGAEGEGGEGGEGAAGDAACGSGGEYEGA